MKTGLKLLLAVGLLSVSTSAMAESYVETLRQIAGSSRRIRVEGEAIGAQQSENLTGLTLANPEVEMSYQWGSPTGVPPRTTLDVTQSFDFGTLSGAKRALADARNNELSLQKQALLAQVTQEADRLMTEIVYYNRMGQYYASMIQSLTEMRDAVAKGVERGQKTAVDLSLVNIRLTEVENESRLCAIERDQLLRELAQLAGRDNIGWSSNEYMPYSLPADLNGWITESVKQNPEVMLAMQGVATAEKEITLRKRERLPNFSLGYTSEMVKAASYYGVKAGVELPLWANRGRVKAAQAARNASAMAREDAEFQYKSQMTSLYQKAVSMRQLAETTKALRNDESMRRNLNKMFELGRISVHEYLEQLLPIMELDMKVNQSERDYQLALVAFRAGRI